MKVARARGLVLWTLAMLAGAVIVWNSRFSADMSFFLPAHPTAAQQILVGQLKEGVVSRLLMVGISGGDANQRAILSRKLRSALLGGGQFVSIQNGERGSQQAELEFLYRHRYLLSPAVTPARFSVDGLRDAISGSIDLLASPAGMMLKKWLVSDPTGEVWALLSELDASSQPDSRGGVWASRDGLRALLLLQTTALGSDTDGQERAIEAVRHAFDTIRKTLRMDDARLALSGPGLFAVKTRETIKTEVARLSLISALAIISVLFFVYRSPRLVCLGLLPVISGALAGVVAVSLAFGTVFGITVGFGAALIGEAVDYSIYYFVQSGSQGATTWYERFWPTVRLGVLTSAAGFGVLLLSGFPGLAQLGLYSLTGVVTAALATRYILPLVAGDRVPVRDLQGFGIRLDGWIGRLRSLRWVVLVLAGFAVAYLVTNRANLWHADLSALSTVTAEDVAVDQPLRVDIGAPDARYLVVASGTDRDAALEAAERAGRKLDALVATGSIGGYDSPARFLPSLATQRARQAALPEADVLRQRLAGAQDGSPLPAARLEPFVKDVASARLAEPIERATLDGTALAQLVDSLMLRGAAGWSALLPLRPASGDSSASIPSDAVRAALVGSGARFLDMKGEFDHLYASYLEEAMVLALAGLAAIVLLLAGALRSPGRLARVLLPLVLAVVFVMATISVLGQRLHLLHLVGLLLIVAVGSNYALFFDRQQHNGVVEPTTLASMSIATLTTTIGFGTLGLSSVPVLHAVGITVGPGAVLALLLSAVFSGRSHE